MVGKKGFEVQLHWVFVMVAGILILTFFFMMATRQRSLSQTKLEATLSSDVESVLVGAIVSKGVAQSLPSIPQGLDFSCSSGCDCKISIGKAEQPFENKVIFSPETLIDRPSVVWSVDWKFPYRIANFLYLTNPDYKYYFVHDDSQLSRSLHEQLVRNIPPPIMTEGNIYAEVNFESVFVSEVSSITAQDVEHTRFVFVNVEPVSLDNSFRRKSFDAVSIVQQPQAMVRFYEGDGTSFNYVTGKAYAGLPSLYGAVFANDVDMYKCGLQSAFKRMAFISLLFAERASKLQAQSESARCNYLSLVSSLNKQSSLALQLSSSSELDYSLMASLSGWQSQISAENRGLIEKSCPELF